MRPTKYEPDFPQRAKQLAREGLTDLQIAEALGVSKVTYYKYQRDYPEFLNSINDGKAPVNAMVEETLLKVALGYEYEEQTIEQSIEMDEEGNKKVIGMKVKKTKKRAKPEMKAIAMWLCNRFGKRWTGTTEEAGPTNTVDEVRALLDGMESAPRYQLTQGEEK